MTRKFLAILSLLVLSSCNQADQDAPADGPAIKNPPVEINPSPQSGTGGDMPGATEGKAARAGQSKPQ
jgi:hypothetical protein